MSAAEDIFERRRLRGRQEGRRAPRYLREPRGLHPRATRRSLGRFSILDSGRFVDGPSPLGCWLGNGCLGPGDFGAIADTISPFETGMLYFNKYPQQAANARKNGVSTLAAS